MDNTIEQMWLDNRGLVYYIYNKLPDTAAKKRFKEDIIEEGMVGLLKGCQTFKDSKGIAPATYLSRCIQNRIAWFFRHANRWQKLDSLDDVVYTSKDDNEEITVGDCISANEEDHFQLPIEQYVDIHFKHNPKCSVPRCTTHFILKELQKGSTQSHISKALNMSQSYISRIIRDIGKSIDLELGTNRTREIKRRSMKA